MTDGNQTTEIYPLEAHQPGANKSIDLTGLECKPVEVAISLPGNCEEKKILGALLISEH